jgi:phosphohistidine phosphatase
MKQLYLLRHAHSEKSFLNKDHERIISVKGNLEIEFLSSYFKRNEFTPETILTSSATRTIQTAKKIISELALDESILISKESLYEATINNYYEELRKIGNSINNLLMIGHNPTILELASNLVGHELNYLPTCGLIKVQLDFNRWESINEGIGQISGFVHMGSLLR